MEYTFRTFGGFSFLKVDTEEGIWFDEGSQPIGIYSSEGGLSILFHPLLPKNFSITRSSYAIRVSTVCPNPSRDVLYTNRVPKIDEETEIC